MALLSLGWSVFHLFKECLSRTGLTSSHAFGSLAFLFRRLLNDFHPSIQEKVFSEPSWRHAGLEEGDCMTKRHICALLFQCKHILAIYLCRAMGVTQQESVSDQQMTVILSGADASWRPGASGLRWTSLPLARGRPGTRDQHGRLIRLWKRHDVAFFGFPLGELRVGFQGNSTC